MTKDQRKLGHAVVFGVILSSTIIGTTVFFVSRRQGFENDINWLGLAALWGIAALGFAWVNYDFFPHSRD
ncbi:hypothetical protein [Pseudooceanicola marinus]|uniref:hypothetical protein n=1 Tax=Pseudooceanicola marinus TaxID=396013 RepID=UPI001CD7AC65|nr:hypothetical protein [Pseudooceanicola marinus]MCA1336320.1 hypothetical protein [Pseudooceanicola marinus]